ncbi:DUF2771 domain-containing protein [Prauserella sp. PE36]|uniref:DUF2771 family protein n=1 Tax=Prauserella sp. PE36 TaxID=1504709 RepID=UPI000DE55511|nr:DUF2771 family protein [Prauserella sp. PE36]RBM10260.1 DUF2771 domain-containing protein [Prauserella sp. PE36]
MRRAVVAVLGAAAVVLAGCSGTHFPEVTFYADGESVAAEPMDQYCDGMLKECEPAGERVSLKVRPGKSVQVSLPSEVTSTVWTLYAEYRDASGAVKLLPPRTFTDRDDPQQAVTVTPENPTDQLLTVEIQQLGGVYAADQQGNPILDENGNPQLLARGVWSLKIDPA